jgi:hypothetical protein
MFLPYFYRQINPTKKLLKAHFEILKETETEIMLWPRGNLSTGGQLLEETIETESINSPEPILRG